MSLFYNLFSLGITDDTTRDDVLRIRLINQIAVLLFVMEIPYYFIFQKMGLSLASILVIPAAFSNIIVLLFNYYKKHFWAGLCLILFCSITLLYYSSVLGRESNAQLVYFSLMPLGFVFFFKKTKWHIFSGVLIPLCSLLLLELTHFSLFPTLDIPHVYRYLISLFANGTTVILLILSVYFFYESLKNATEELYASNIKLADQHTRLETQQTLLKRRITAIHTMTESCKTRPEWEWICVQIFRHHLNMTPRVWLADEGQELSVESVSDYLAIEDVHAQMFLYKTGCFTWNEAGVSVLLPLVSGSTLVGLIGLSPDDVLSDDDREFAGMVAKSLQKTLQLIRSTEAMKTLNVVAFVQKNEALFRGMNITDRELEIIGLLVHGMSNAQISASLMVTESTTKRHIYNIFRKLKISNRFELMKWMNARIVETFG